MLDAVVYVDADNQAPALAGALLEALAARDLRASAIQLFGNARASQLQMWRDSLVRAGVPARHIASTEVPCRSQAADIALLLALGARLAGHVAADSAAVIVTRDNLLLGAAQRLQDLGARVLVCHAAAAPCRGGVEAATLVPGRVRPETVQLLGRIRAELQAEPGGGYRKSLVGMLLRRAGLDRCDRAAFLASLPGLRTARTAGDRLLFI